jgi:hypothetical protein
MRSLPVSELHPKNKKTNLLWEWSKTSRSKKEWQSFKTLMNIKIFIASSSELSDERNKIHEIFDRFNKCHQHLNIEPVKWETEGKKEAQKIKDSRTT